jgi:Co/Zn/Cd efflux system component
VSGRFANVERVSRKCRSRPRRAHQTRYSWNDAHAPSAGIVADATRRFLFGSDPLGAAMVGFSLSSLFVNVTVLRMLAQYRQGEVHMRASWICTRADVVANFGVLASGLTVLATGWRYADLVVGLAISIYVAKEAIEIWQQSRNSGESDTTLSES